MGRTKRRRAVRHSQDIHSSLDHENSTISLRKWLKENGFSDTLGLQLRNFTQTGRGVTSSKSVNKNDVLIRVPLDLLITFDTVEKSGLLNCLVIPKRFTTQTLIAFYLAFEKHKDRASTWRSYIDSLPYPEPILPWMGSTGEINIFPDDLKFAARKLEETFKECLLHLKESISSTALCDCCKKPIACVLEANLFKWAYVLVNTRAVYIDPKNINSKNSYISILSDGPSMALCPFLDMFNHNHLAETKVSVVSIQGQRFYELRAMTSFKKYEQFFISYGSHDNDKLLMEYGFFIPGNIFDCVKFTFKEVMDILRTKFNERQYRYLKSHEFDARNIYINSDGVSFNLKAILFVSYNPSTVNYDAVVFGDTYPSDFQSVVDNCSRVLLDFKLKVFKNDIDRLKSHASGFDARLRLIKDFLDYRIEFIQQILSRTKYSIMKD